MIVTVNGETVMTQLEDLKRFQADVQPGSDPPLWRQFLIIAAIRGITKTGPARLDITTDHDGGWTMQAIPYAAASPA